MNRTLRHVSETVKTGTSRAPLAVETVSPTKSDRLSSLYASGGLT
ncbi:MAG: hypothetical protein ACYTHM_11625 [Planctomycetota bacterium]